MVGRENNIYFFHIFTSQHLNYWDRLQRVCVLIFQAEVLTVLQVNGPFLLCLGQILIAEEIN